MSTPRPFTWSPIILRDTQNGKLKPGERRPKLMRGRGGVEFPAQCSLSSPRLAYDLVSGNLVAVTYPERYGMCPQATLPRWGSTFGGGRYLVRCTLYDLWCACVVPQILDPCGVAGAKSTTNVCRGAPGFCPVCHLPVSPDFLAGELRVIPSTMSCENKVKSGMLSTQTGTQWVLLDGYLHPFIHSLESRPGDGYPML